MPVHVSDDARVNELLNRDPNALLIGMLLDQQITIGWAFTGPLTLLDRLGHLDPLRISNLPEDDFVAVACEKPAIHRYPAVMARRIQALCSTLVADHGGQAEAIWADVDDAAQLRKRLRALPGFGPEKVKIFIALLAKRFNIRPTGWEEAAGVFADSTPRSVADMADADTEAAVRDWKAAQKAARLDKQDRPIT